MVGAKTHNAPEPRLMPVRFPPACPPALACAGEGGGENEFDLGWLGELHPLGDDGERPGCEVDVTHSGPIAGRLGARLDRWRSVTDDATVLDLVENGLRIPLVDGVWPEEHHDVRNNVVEEHVAWLDEQVEALQAAGAVRTWEEHTEILRGLGRTPGPRPRVVMPLLVHFKPGSTPEKELRRLIQDCRWLNVRCEDRPFGLDAFADFMKRIRRGDYLWSIDMKSEYFHVLVHLDFVELLGFCWRGRYYVGQLLEVRGVLTAEDVIEYVGDSKCAEAIFRKGGSQADYDEAADELPLLEALLDIFAYAVDSEVQHRRDGRPLEVQGSSGLRAPPGGHGARVARAGAVGYRPVRGAAQRRLPAFLQPVRHARGRVRGRLRPIVGRGVRFRPAGVRPELHQPSAGQDRARQRRDRVRGAVVAKQVVLGASAVGGVARAHRRVVHAGLGLACTASGEPAALFLRALVRLAAFCVPDEAHRVAAKGATH